MRHIRIKVGAGYDVIIDKDIDFGAVIKERLKKALKIALVSDDIVFGLYGERVAASLKSVGFEVFTYVFKNGESSKNVDEYCRILEFLAKVGLTRTDALAALGGGVTGDLAGFAAATYLRGINFVQLPTTLLAAVDSSIGGKTGINLSAGKNLAGAFHQPSAVLCDVGFLETLSEDLIADGMGEIIKHAVLKGGELLDELEKYDGEKRGMDAQKNEVLDGEKHGIDARKNEVLDGEKRDADRENFSYDWGKIITLSIAVKAEFVERDEKEQDIRRLLNLGHTVGHAVEKLSNYEIRHGKCVAIGLAYIARLSWEKGFLDYDTQNRILELFSRHGLDIRCPYELDDMIEVIRSDKKISGETLSFVVIRGIGHCQTEDIPIGSLQKWIEVVGRFI